MYASNVLLSILGVALLATAAPTSTGYRVCPPITPTIKSNEPNTQGVHLHGDVHQTITFNLPESGPKFNCEVKYNMTSVSDFYSNGNPAVNFRAVAGPNNGAFLAGTQTFQEGKAGTIITAGCSNTMAYDMQMANPNTTVSWEAPSLGIQLFYSSSNCP